MNTGNPQEIGLAAWLAGIIDGEGSISLLVSKRADKFRSQTLRVVPTITIGNTDEGIIAQTIAALKAIGVGVYVQHKRPPARRLLGVAVKEFKPVTTVQVSGFLRVRKVLYAMREWLAGSKRERADLLLRFMECRLGQAETARTGRNLTYCTEDVDNILAFLRVTKTKNIDHITKILNDHTREARVCARKLYKREHNLANRELQNAQRRERRRKLRYDLTSRETVRADGNDQPPAV